MKETSDRGALGAAKALDLIGDVDKRKREGKSPPLALCRGCHAPLISTFAFPGAEFYCVECGRTCGFLNPMRGDGDDPQLQERYEGLKVEWDENAGEKLMPGGAFWQRGCEGCESEEGRRLGHWEHATDEEREADKKARAWLKERAA